MRLFVSWLLMFAGLGLVALVVWRGWYILAAPALVLAVAASWVAKFAPWGRR
jgi:hypothetical protein